MMAIPFLLRDSCHGFPHPKSEAAAERSYPMSEVRGGGQEEQPHIQGAAAARAQEGQKELLNFKVRRGGPEEIPLIQGKQ